MSSASARQARVAPLIVVPTRQQVGIGQIFLVFLLIGATSFGGGVVAHLRNRVVAGRRWVDDTLFVELLGISQTLPGLNATNLAILIGDRLRGTFGAIAAISGLCLPGATLMCVVGMVYQAERERPFVEAGLQGVAAAAVGLILATILQLGRRVLSRVDDLVFVLLAVVCVNRLQIPVPRALVVIGFCAVAWQACVTAAKKHAPR